MRYIWVVFFAVIVFGVTSCCSCPPPQHERGPFNIVFDDTLRKRDGTALLLRGMNARIKDVFDVTFNDGRVALEPIPDFTDDDALQMAEWGFNFLRLPINWSALEPERDQFNDAYLARIKQIVDICAKHGVYVLIDFHQDAYSKEFGEDGAPLWAIEPPPTKLLEGPMHDLDARRTSKQVLDAFISFFDNVNGLQDEFADAVRYTDRYFGDDPNVVGFEIMNEPIAGADNSRLIPFYLKVIDRTANPKRVWFFEPNVIRNQTDKMQLSSEIFPRRNVVYSPHIYTDVFTLGAKNFESNDPDMLKPSMVAAKKEAEAWGAPLLVGEFGIGPFETNAVTWYTTQIDLQNLALAHSAFWVWKEDSQGAWGMFSAASDGTWTPRDWVVRAVSGPFPQEVQGDLTAFQIDRSKNTAVAAVRLTGDGRIRWAVPTLWFPQGAKATCDGAPALVVAESKGFLDVTCPLETTKSALAAK